MHNLEDYQKIQLKLNSKIFQLMEVFVQNHSNFSLEDVMYDMKVFEKFEVWKDNREIDHLKYFYDGLKHNSLYNLNVEDLMKELIQNPKLKKYVLNYANHELKGNSLHDKNFLLDAIRTFNTDVINNHDTEVREKFVLSFKGGCKNMIVDLRKEKNKKSQQEKNKNNEEVR